MSGTRILAFVSACAIGMVTAGAHGQCSPSGLDDGPLEVTKGGLNIDVHYTDDTWLDCGIAGDYFPMNQAQQALNGIDTSYDLYDSFGFPEPYVSNLPEYNIFIYDSSDTGAAEPSCFTVDSPNCRCMAEPQLRQVLHHEMFHHIQRRHMCSVAGADCNSNYIGSTFGKWVAEGNARCMDDRLYSDLDGSTLGISFWGEVSKFMDQPDLGLTAQSYRACLFWSYCCEQLGSVSTEPQRGVDFMRRFWEQIAANGTTDSMQALRDEIQDSGGGSLDKIYHDFAICTYTREFDVSALPNSSRYRFLDEQPGNGGGPAYDDVIRAGIFNSFPATTSSNIVAYAAKYYEMTFDPSTCAAVGFLGEADEPIGWALVGITPDDRAVILSKGVGRDYGRTFLNSPTEPINRLGAIVVGLSEPSGFSFRFDVGTPRISIIRPTTTHLAYAGKASEPGRFLVRVFVEGPDALKPPGVGPRSIKGLRQDDFTVRVNNVDAGVISASYVGGEYWLAVQAPEQPADGLYDLQVVLCDGVASSIQDISKSSVLYADIKINHMVVIDRSGSMSAPADFSKLDAAKIAGSLYVDAVSDNDRVGVVAFDGNTTSCDDDAVTLETLGTATVSKRNNCRTDISNLSPTGMTSIGDGLWKAQDQLDLFITDGDIHTAILLSDGEENEARWWESNSPCAGAASRVVPADTIVNTIAFGPQSNQSLMQSIAASTGGEYSYVDVTDAAAGANATPGKMAAGKAGANGPIPHSMANQLADAYMKGLQKSRRLERLFFTADDIGSGNNASITIPVLEAGVSQGTVFVNWSKSGGLKDLKLLKPNGNPPSAAEATLYETDTHAVWHLHVDMNPGDWRVQFSAGGDTDYIVGLLGQQRFGVQMLVEVTQVNTGGLVNEPDEGPFEQGVPVTILAVLTDAKGPVLGADLELSVRRPDGTFACGPLTLRDDGSQNDGEADDGVYGAIFTDTSQAGERGGVLNDDPKIPPPPGVPGTYLVNITGRGESMLAGKFIRYGATAFHIYAARRDRDQDGLPDTWEVYYGTDPSKPDADQDPDGDGLRNDEEFKHGTHPFDQDTDGGGEPDGSEVKAGRCPIEPSDDAMPCPVDVEVVTSVAHENPGILKSNALLLRFPIHPSYLQMRIFRRKLGDTTFQLIDTVDLKDFKPPYYDEGLPNGTTFEYRFQAVGLNGALSCLSPIVQGTAKAQPIPPNPWAKLNNDSALTDRLIVVGYLDHTGQLNGSMPTHYRVSDIPPDPVQPYLLLPAGPVIWQLPGLPGVPGLKRLYVQYRDAAGNESEPILTTIYYDPHGDFDNDGEPNDADTDDDGDGLSDDDELLKGLNAFDPDCDDDGLDDGDEIKMGTNPRNPDTDGDGLLDGEDPYPLYPVGPPDADGDGDVDSDDTDAFITCVTGPELGPASPECAGFDFDEDGDVDQSDYGVFQQCYSGTDTLYDQGCVN